MAARKRVLPSKLFVEGLKSCAERTEIELAPLTILSGANSSGKSTIMQGALLVKQTVEAPYDPGPVLLSGPHYEWTRNSQLLSRLAEGGCVDKLKVGFVFGPNEVTLDFALNSDAHGLALSQLRESSRSRTTNRVTKRVWREGMTHSTILKKLPETLKALTQSLGEDSAGPRWEISRDHCLLYLDMSLKGFEDSPFNAQLVTTGPSADIRSFLARLLHLPALRGRPTRTYPITSTGPSFTGPFQPYTASLIEHWHSHVPAKADELDRWLSALGLAAGVCCSRVSDTELAVMVTRSKYSNAEAEESWVDIADTGFGMSQSLPILVALIGARKGDWVYIEQPEIHLHPNAQLAFVDLLTASVSRGVRVILETHSRLTLTGVQTSVASDAPGSLDPSDVQLHWFTQDPVTGYTRVRPGQLDEHGRYGDWPQDFADVSMRAEHNFLLASLRSEATAQ